MAFCAAMFFMSPSINDKVSTKLIMIPLNKAFNLNLMSRGLYFSHLSLKCTWNFSYVSLKLFYALT